MDEDEKTARVVVPGYQLSLAIGREGQNARLAARLTGYKIDIKSDGNDDGYYDEAYQDSYYQDGYAGDGEGSYQEDGYDGEEYSGEGFEEWDEEKEYREEGYEGKDDRDM